MKTSVCHRLMSEYKPDASARVTLRPLACAAGLYFHQPSEAPTKLSKRKFGSSFCISFGTTNCGTAHLRLAMTTADTTTVAIVIRQSDTGLMMWFSCDHNRQVYAQRGTFHVSLGFAVADLLCGFRFVHERLHSSSRRGRATIRKRLFGDFDAMLCYLRFSTKQPNVCSTRLALPLASIRDDIM